MTDNRSPWVARAQRSALPYKVLADTHAHIVREDESDILRRTMPTVGPDDSGMLTFDPFEGESDYDMDVRVFGADRYTFDRELEDLRDAYWREHNGGEA